MFDKDKFLEAQKAIKSEAAEHLLTEMFMEGAEDRAAENAARIKNLRKSGRLSRRATKRLYVNPDK